MKKVIITLAIIFFSFLAGNGQTYIGVRTGYNMSIVNFLPTQYERIYYRMAGDFGATLKFFDMEYVGLQAELNYIERGYRLPVREWEFYLRNNRYLELPMFMQGRYMYKNNFVHLNIGCYGAFLLFATEGLNTTGTFVLEKIKLNVLYDKRFDFGLAGGIGLGREFKWGTLQVDGRIFYGYTDLFDHTYIDMPRQSRSYVESVSFSYYLNLTDLRSNLKEKNQKKVELIDIGE